MTKKSAFMGEKTWKMTSTPAFDEMLFVLLDRKLGKVAAAEVHKESVQF